MKAIVCHKYGPPEILQLEEVEKPTPKENEKLVRVFATVVTSGNVRPRRADPFLARFVIGFIKPKKKILGINFAGKIEAAAANR